MTPGPVFTTATFIGYLLGGPAGAAVATVGIFLPAFVFVAVSVPLLPRLRRSAVAGAFLDGVNVASLALMAVVTWQLGRAAVVDAPTVAAGRRQRGRCCSAAGSTRPGWCWAARRSASSPRRRVGRDAAEPGWRASGAGGCDSGSTSSTTGRPARSPSRLAPEAARDGPIIEPRRIPCVVESSSFSP